MMRIPETYDEAGLKAWAEAVTAESVFWIPASDPIPSELDGGFPPEVRGKRVFYVDASGQVRDLVAGDRYPGFARCFMAPEAAIRMAIQDTYGEMAKKLHRLLSQLEEDE